MQQRVGVVIPLYKVQPNALEVVSLRRCAEVLGQYPTVLLAPEGLDLARYEEIFPKAVVWRFPTAYFASLESYSRWLLSPAFYENFLGIYEKICIVQPDVFLCYDALEDFCDLPHDYFGAPLGLFRHDRYELYGGNGGICLRDVAACTRLLKNEEVAKNPCKPLEEDEYFSYCGEAFPALFRVAPLSVAVRFAFDRFPRLLMEVNQGQLPMAIHGWWTYDAYFCRRILAGDLPTGLDFGRENLCLSALAAFRDFMAEHPRIFFYGAGDFGKTFFQYAQAEGFDVEGFLLSDGQPRTETSYHDKPIQYLSAWRGDKEQVGIVTTTGRLTRENIACRLRQEGFRHVFLISEALCNAIFEALLQKRFHDSGGLDEMKTSVKGFPENNDIP